MTLRDVLSSPIFQSHSYSTSSIFLTPPSLLPLLSPCFLPSLLSSPAGLDAASSRELLAHLNELAGSNRTVVLTIHQPRLEIFHMFDRLVLLSDGKVYLYKNYHGLPCKIVLQIF